MIRMRPPRSVCTTASNMCLAEWPSVTHRGSRIECSGSSIVTESRSPKIVVASSKKRHVSAGCCDSFPYPIRRVSPFSLTPQPIQRSTVSQYDGRFNLAAGIGTGTAGDGGASPFPKTKASPLAKTGPAYLTLFLIGTSNSDLQPEPLNPFSLGPCLNPLTPSACIPTPQPEPLQPSAYRLQPTPPSSSRSPTCR